MKQGLRRGFVVAVLGWLAIVVSGCAVTKAPEAPTDVPQAQPAGGDAYTQAAEALAQEAQPIVRQVPGDGASAAAEAEGCGLAGDGVYDGALYSAEEPLASGIELVSAEDDCNKEHIQCFRDCWKEKPPYPYGAKGSDGHNRYCTETCRKEYVACMKKAGLMKEFSVMSAALDWLKSNAKVIVIGTAVVIAGVVYVVSTGGSGALVLTLLPAVT